MGPYLNLVAQCMYTSYWWSNFIKYDTCGRPYIASSAIELKRIWYFSAGIFLYDCICRSTCMCVYIYEIQNELIMI